MLVTLRNPRDRASFDPPQTPPFQELKGASNSDVDDRHRRRCYVLVVEHGGYLVSCAPRRHRRPNVRLPDDLVDGIRYVATHRASAN
jgi:hypothetical protein